MLVVGLGILRGWRYGKRLLDVLTNQSLAEVQSADTFGRWAQDFMLGWRVVFDEAACCESVVLNCLMTCRCPCDVGGLGNGRNS